MSVGISANEQLFARRQSQYYLDLAEYVKNELMTRPEFFPPFRTKQRYKKELYRYRMSVAENKRQKVWLTVKNLDTAFWFFLFDPSRAFKKLKILLHIK